jgi:ankyrin repeat protein
VQNDSGWAPLHAASRSGYLDIVLLLMEHGANLEGTDNDRNTLLHVAAQNGNLAASRLPVEHGAIVTVKNKVGWTPLHEASHRGHPDVVQFLLEHTANGRAGQRARDSEGKAGVHTASARVRNKIQTPVQIASGERTSRNPTAAL